MLMNASLARNLPGKRNWALRGKPWGDDTLFGDQFGWVESPFRDDFTDLSLDLVPDGSANWATYFVGWNVRYLTGNGDKAYKAYHTNVGSGGPSLQDLGIITHERTAQNTLKLYGAEIPAANQEQFGWFPYAGGMITSELSRWARYGWWEARVRFTLTKGHHWAIWLVPKDGSWPPEIDLVEVVSGDGNFYMNAHGTGQDELVWFAPSDYGGWHTFRFEWTPFIMRWLVDGVERKQRPNYIDKEMYFMITPEIGGNWPGLPDGTTQWPTSAEIAYVAGGEL